MLYEETDYVNQPDIHDINDTSWKICETVY